MAISLAKIGVWRCIGVGIVLEVLHLALRSRWPGLSPHFIGPRGLCATVLLYSEYFMIMLSLLVATQASFDLFCARQFSKATIIVIAFIGYLVLYAIALEVRV
jgi:hypothetical protein